MPCRLQLQSEHVQLDQAVTISSACRTRPEGSYRLGLPHRADLRRELSLHTASALELPASQPEQETATTCDAYGEVFFPG